MPQSVSDFMKVQPETFGATGAFDAILDVDSLLFIDPHLLRSSSAPEIAGSYEQVTARFSNILKVLNHSQQENDPFWNSAVKLFTFPELKGLCIGYSGKSTSGSGMGPALRLQILRTAKVIVDAGNSDPEIFELVGVFEDNVGPDRISDMVGRIIIDELLTYTERILIELGIKADEVVIGDKIYKLLHNPYNDSPIILLPRDILRDLPVAQDWERHRYDLCPQ